MIVPMIKLNYGIDFYYQEDNSRVHKSKKETTFMHNSNIKVIKWPSRSPDLNIVEDIWKMISSRVYDGPQFDNKQKLAEKVIDTINNINKKSRHAVVNLYRTYRSRLVTVLKGNDHLFNK